MTIDLCQLTALELGPLLASREVSPVEVIRAVQARLDETEPFLNAYIARLDEQALAEAAQAEQEIAAGRYRGPLHGVPIAIKDNLAVAGTITTAGSKVLADNRTPEDAEVVRRLRAAGAIVVGKTNMVEMAAGAKSVNPHYGNVRNPWGPNHDASGSSGGSAASVAARQVPLSLGTDAGGSVRLPAAVCGVVGLKQTHGRASARGMLASQNVTVDHIGPFGRTVADVALVLETMAGYDLLDPSSADRPVPSYRAALRTDLEGVRVGVPSNYYFDLLDPEIERGVRAAIGVLEQLGAETVSVALPDLEEMMNVRAASGGEGLALHDPYLHADRMLYGEDLRNRLLANYFITGRDLARANRVRRLIKEHFARAFQEVDLLATPTAVSPAVPLTDESFTLRDYRTGQTVEVPIPQVAARLTSPTNQTGLPSISVPGGFSEAGLPIGFQLIARAFEEGLLLGAAHAYEQATRWYTRQPPYAKAAVPA